jgi:ABC-type Na+ efflux pump permease subunit
MLPGPIFRREVKAGARRRDLFRLRILFTTLLGVIAVAPAIVLFGAAPAYESHAAFESMRNYWLIIFGVVTGFEIGFVVMWTLGVVSSSISQEREKDTLPLLLLTRLTRLELVATKLAGRLMPPFMLMSSGLPLVLFCAWYSGISAVLVLEILAVSITSVSVAGSLAILASARREQSTAARMEAASWTMLWLVFLPMISLVPARTGTLWGDLLVELRRLASWIAPSSPLSILTNPSWFARASASALSDRLLLMIAFQMVLIALAVCGAVASLRRREPHRSSSDTFGGYRPPVSDDPIFWREYVLPWRGSRGPAIFIQMRYMWIMIRGIFLMLLQLALFALVVAVPIAMLVSVGWFGFLAFRELWEQRSYAGGTYQARDQFNLCVRAVTAMLGVFPIMSIPALVAARFTTERDKKTWESLLMTSLTGAEILAAKTRATSRGLRTSFRWLIPLGVLGVACGSIHPLGALIAAVGLPLLVWMGLALGTWLGIRPDSTIQAATSASSLWSLGLLVIGALVTIAPLCSIREFAIFWSWDARVRWPIVIALPASLLMTGLFARSLTRRCYQNFDVWVGRPHRGPKPAASESTPA